MATGKIQVPGIEVPGTDSITVEIGETLFIEFVEDCNFCCEPTQVDSFVPQLPLGSHKKGSIWSGVAQVSGTIGFHHTKYGEPCSGKPSSVGADARSIQIGS